MHCSYAESDCKTDLQSGIWRNRPNFKPDLQEAEEKQRSVIGKRMTAPKAFPRVALDLATTVERIQQNFVICDPNLPDCPIVFASDGFIELTQYPRHEVLGRNCRSVSSETCASRNYWRHNCIKHFAYAAVLNAKWAVCWCAPGLTNTDGAGAVKLANACCLWQQKISVCL